MSKIASLQWLGSTLVGLVSVLACTRGFSSSGAGGPLALDDAGSNVTALWSDPGENDTDAGLMAMAPSSEGGSNRASTDREQHPDELTGGRSGTTGTNSSAAATGGAGGSSTASVGTEGEKPSNGAPTSGGAGGRGAPGTGEAGTSEPGLAGAGGEGSEWPDWADTGEAGTSAGGLPGAGAAGQRSTAPSEAGTGNTDLPGSGTAGQASGGMGGEPALLCESSCSGCCSDQVCTDRKDTDVSSCGRSGEVCRQCPADAECKAGVCKGPPAEQVPPAETAEPCLDHDDCNGSELCVAEEEGAPSGDCRGRCPDGVCSDGLDCVELDLVGDVIDSLPLSLLSPLLDPTVVTVSVCLPP